MKKQIKKVLGLGILASVLGSFIYYTPSRKKSFDIYTAGLEEQLIKHEGYRDKVYFDTRGIPTIGIGFNLKRSDARQKIKEVGADYDKVVSGQQSLNSNQIMLLFRSDLTNAINSAKKLISNYDKQPKQIQDVAVNMVYNLGERGFESFVKTRNAIQSFDYETAASELKNSRWYSQVGNRSRELFNIVRNLSKTNESYNFVRK